MKICRHCNGSFPETHYYHDRAVCKDCVRAKMREAQKDRYRNGGGKAYLYDWFEQRGGQKGYRLSLALKRQSGDSDSETPPTTP